MYKKTNNYRYLSGQHSGCVTAPEQPAIIMDNLNNHAITIQGMTPEECKHGGENLEIHYSFATCPFGEVLVASAPKGICNISFIPEDKATALDELQRRFPQATYRHKTEHSHLLALTFFGQGQTGPKELNLHLKGTQFQLKVWDALLEIPKGKLSSYGDIARMIEHPKAYRAVGSAVGDNPVFFVIPCHRVIQSSGAIGNYYWGSKLKTEIIEWEKQNTDKEP